MFSVHKQFEKHCAPESDFLVWKKQSLATAIELAFKPGERSDSLTNSSLKMTLPRQVIEL